MKETTRGQKYSHLLNRHVYNWTSSLYIPQDKTYLYAKPQVLFDAHFVIWLKSFLMHK